MLLRKNNPCELFHFFYEEAEAHHTIENKWPNLHNFYRQRNDSGPWEYLNDVRRCEDSFYGWHGQLTDRATN